NNEGSNFAHLKDFLCEAAGNRYAKDDPAFCVEMLEYIAKLETRVTAFSSAQASTSLRPISV
ncbi:MAG TPA: hypothetical protein VLG38_02705, partial [Gammaproteobacteria bacterium]|nr:hypothetical protein [Gammaproteobacteria bacterium]